MTTRQKILDFLDAFPDRHAWIDEKSWEDARLDGDADLFIRDTGEGIDYHVDNKLVVPMFDDIAIFLNVDDVGSCLHENGLDYEFGALGRGFNVGLHFFDVHGRRQDFGRDGSSVRVMARLEPDPQWDEDNEGDPLEMTCDHGRSYRFANN